MHEHQVYTSSVYHNTGLFQFKLLPLHLCYTFLPVHTPTLRR